MFSQKMYVAGYAEVSFYNKKKRFGAIIDEHGHMFHFYKDTIMNKIPEEGDHVYFCGQEKEPSGLLGESNNIEIISLNFLS